MPGLSLYEVSVPTFTKGLKTLASILTKAEEHAKEKGVNPDSYVSTALAEDMRPLSFQVQVCSGTVKKCIWRLTGDEPENWDDNETTIAQLKARIQKTIDLLDSVDAKKVDGKEDTIVELQMGKQGSMNLPAKAYVFNYAMPNFFFHLQTAYSILRMKGVPLGKTDYLTAFMS